jgi:hypothetical protein
MVARRVRCETGAVVGRDALRAFVDVDETGGRVIGAATGTNAGDGALPVSKRAAPRKASPCPPSSTARRLTISLVADVLEGLVVEPELNKIASSSPISIQLSNRLTVSKLI